jgi:hypothetical protein
VHEGSGRKKGRSGRGQKGTEVETGKEDMKMGKGKKNWGGIRRLRRGKDYKDKSSVAAVSCQELNVDLESRTIVLGARRTLQVHVCIPSGTLFPLQSLMGSGQK